MVSRSLTFEVDGTGLVTGVGALLSSVHLALIRTLVFMSLLLRVILGGPHHVPMIARVAQTKMIPVPGAKTTTATAASSSGASSHMASVALVKVNKSLDMETHIWLSAVSMALAAMRRSPGQGSL
jgi:hypothetical protein